MRVALLCVSSFLALTAAAAAAPSFERTPAPPRVFDGIRAGMSVIDARPALAAFQPDAAYKDAVQRTRLVRDAGDGAKYYVLVKGEVVSRIGVEAPARGLVSRLEKLWGRAAQTTNIGNEPITFWQRAGWRVDLSCRGELCRMAFHQPLTAAYFGTTVQPPGVLAGVRVGMTRDALAQLSPKHLASDVPAGPEDVRTTVEVTRSGHVQSVLVGGLPHDARAVLEQAWGAGTPVDGGAVWFNPDRGWRAQYSAPLQALQFTGYVAGTKLLGPGKGIALLAKPILGATRAQVAKAYPGVKADGKKLVFALPPSEAGMGKIEVSHFDATTQRAKRVALSLPVDSPARRAELVQLMAAKWGTPAVKTVGGIATRVFPTGATLAIELTETPATLELVLKLP